MPFTTYFSNFTSRDIRDVNLSDAGGITHEWFSGPVLYPYVLLTVNHTTVVTRCPTQVRLGAVLHNLHLHVVVSQHPA
jgi:hypothetical protein